MRLLLGGEGVGGFLAEGFALHFASVFVAGVAASFAIFVLVFVAMHFVSWLVGGVAANVASLFVEIFVLSCGYVCLISC